MDPSIVQALYLKISLIATIVPTVIGAITTLLLNNYIGKRLENMATKADIAEIAAREQSGVLKTDAQKALVHATSSAISRFQRISLDMSITALAEKHKFDSEPYLKLMFEATSGLIERLDEHSFLVSRAGQAEINHFRETLPLIFGAETDDIKWMSKTFNAVSIRQNAIVILRERLISEFQNPGNFNESEAKKAYDLGPNTRINNLTMESRRRVGLELAALSYDLPAIKELIDVQVNYYVAK